MTPLLSPTQLQQMRPLHGPLVWTCGGMAVVVVVLTVTISFLGQSSKRKTDSSPQAASNVARSASMTKSTANVKAKLAPERTPVDLPPADRKMSTKAEPNAPIDVTESKSGPAPVSPKMTGDQIYQRLLGSSVRVLATVQQPGPPVAMPKTEVSPYVGTIWQGSENLQGFGALRFELFEGGTAAMVDAKQQVNGVYRISGDSITLTFFGSCVYQGAVTGDTFSGTASEQDRRWNFSVRRTGTLPKAPGFSPPPPPMITRTNGGSGVLVSAAERLVVTNEHVVEDSNNIIVHFPRFSTAKELKTDPIDYPSDIGVRATVIARNLKTDLALLRLDYLPPGVAEVKLAREKAKPGQQIHSIGNPGASRALWVYSPGRVRQVFFDRWSILDPDRNRTIHYEAMKIDTDSAINPGDSGGPLVNDDAELVGIAHGLDRASRSFSHFIELSEVHALLKSRTNP